MNSHYISLDLGNKFSVAAAPRENGVDILQSETFERLIPSVLGFTDRRLHFGQMAADYQNQNLDGTITNTKSLIGLKWDSENRKKFEKTITYKLVQIENGFTGVAIPFDGSTITFRPAQLVAFIIKLLLRNKDTRRMKLLFVTEPFWGDIERKIILAGADIAGFKVQSMVNSTTASVVKFCHEHPKFIPEDPKESQTICFVDFGDSSITITIAEITKGAIKILNHVFEENLGGRDFTLLFTDYLIEKAEEKYHLNFNEIDTRSIQRFKRAAEKIKCALSVNKSMKFEVPSIGEKDISIIVQRTDFETAVSPLLKTLDAIAREAKRNNPNISFIEFYGGASRPPCVKEIFQKVFECDVRQSLNADECIVAGAAHFSVSKDLIVTDITCYPTYITYKLPSDAMFNDILFKSGTKYGEKKSIVVCTVGDVTIYGNNGDIMKISFEQKEVTKIKLDFEINECGIIELVSTTSQVSGQPIKYNVMVHDKLSSDQIDAFRLLMTEIELRNEEGVLSERLKGELEVALMNVEGGKVKEWFEENEGYLMSSFQYQDALNELSGKKSNAKQEEFRTKIDKIMGKISKLDDQKTRALLYDIIKKTEAHAIL